jgi:hypothetical protein
VINETESPYHLYTGPGKWNAYDITFRAARFKDGKRVEKAMVTMYLNGVKVHKNQTINQVWGVPIQELTELMMKEKVSPILPKD